MGQPARQERPTIQPSTPAHRALRGATLPLALGALVLLGFWGLAFLGELDANADTERDLLRSLALARHGVWPTAGPAIDYLPLALPPTWYYLMAPFLAVWPSPITVHLVHAALLLVGAWTLCRAVGGVGGVAAALAFTTSTWAAEVLAPVWHNGLVPGAGALWLAGIVSASDKDARQSGRGLVLAWLALAALVQVHIVSLAFVPVTIAAHGLHLWRFRRGGRPLPHLVGLASLGGLITVAVIALADAPLAAMQTVLSQRVREPAPLGATGLRTLELLGAKASLVNIEWLLPGLLALGLVAAVRLRSALGALLVLQLAIGLVAATQLAGLDPAPRYFGPAIIGGIGLAALGARWLGESAGRRVSWRAPMWLRVTLAVALPAVLCAQFGRARDGEPVREGATLSLFEQVSVVWHLGAKAGVGLDDLRRLHGAAISARTAIRYAAVSDGWAPASSAGSDRPAHLFAAPKGFPEPPGDVADLAIWQTGRTLRVGSFDPRFTLVEATTRAPDGRTRRCGVPLPFFWNALRPDELRPFHLPPSFDPELCRSRGARDERLRLALEATPGAESMTVVLGWFDVIRHPASVGRLAAEGLTVERLEGPLFEELAVYRVSQAGGLPAQFAIEIGPLETLAVIDIY